MLIAYIQANKGAKYNADSLLISVNAIFGRERRVRLAVPAHEAVSVSISSMRSP